MRLPVPCASRHLSGLGLPCHACLQPRLGLPPYPAELLLLLEDASALEAKVDEAVSVLKQHNAIPGAKQGRGVTGQPAPAPGRLRVGWQGLLCWRQGRPSACYPRPDLPPLSVLARPAPDLPAPCPLAPPPLQTAPWCARRAPALPEAACPRMVSPLGAALWGL